MAAIAQYPNLYGGKQKEFNAAAAEAIREGVLLLKQELCKTDVDCNALFFRLLEQFAQKRQHIAKTHGTKDAEEFGRRRDRDLEPHSTYLSDQYLLYGKRIKNLLAKALPKAIDATHPGLGDREFQIHFRTFDAAKLEGDQTLIFGPKRLILQTKDFGSVSPDLFSTISYQHNAEMGMLIGISPDIGRFISATLYWNGNRETPVTEYLHLYCNNREAMSLEEAMLELQSDPIMNGFEMVKNRYCVLVRHMEGKYIQPSLEKIASLFERIVMQRNPDPIQLKEDLAEFRYRFSHIMPFSRGSGAIGNWIEQALSQLHGYTVTFPEEIMADVEALSQPYFPNFKKNYVEQLKFSN